MIRDGDGAVVGAAADADADADGADVLVSLWQLTVTMLSVVTAVVSIATRETSTL